eukprot:c28461_g1_i3 orf=362-2551(+)
MGDKGTPSGSCRPWETGEGCWSEAGASLPPRKRLLAGLKQNGWFSSSYLTASLAPSCHAAAEGPSAAPMVEVDVEVGVADTETTVQTVVPAEWDDCGASEVEKRNAEVETDAAEEEDLNEVKYDIEAILPTSSSPALNSIIRADMKSQMSTELGSGNCETFAGKALKEEISLVSSGTPSSGSRRKPKMDRELGSVHCEFSTIGVSKEEKLVSPSSSKRKATSPHDMEEAAKVTAAKTETEITETAASKESVAVGAKVTLESATVTARDEAHNVSRSSAAGDSGTAISSKKNKKTKFKWEEEISGTSQINDEELARQLHRVINSSPRISRSQTSLRSNEATKYLDRIPSTEFMKVSPHANLPTVEGKKPPPRSRSSSLKEGKKQESKMARQNSESQSGSKEMDISSQSTCELNKPTLLEAADTVTSVQRTGSLAVEDAAVTTSEEQLETGDTSLSQRVNKPTSHRKRIRNDSDKAKDCNIPGSSVVASSHDSSGLSGLMHDDGSKIRIVEVASSDVYGFVKGEDAKQGPAVEPKEQIYKDRGIIFEESSGFGQSVTPEGVSAKPLDKKNQRAVDNENKESIPKDEPSAIPVQTYTGGKQTGKQGIELLKDIDSLSKLGYAEISSKNTRKVSGSAKSTNVRSDFEEGSSKHLDGETKNCPASKGNNRKTGRSVVKNKSSDTRSKDVSKGHSHIKPGHTEVEQTWHQSFGFGSTSPVPLQTPALASGTRRHS